MDKLTVEIKFPIETKTHRMDADYAVISTAFKIEIPALKAGMTLITKHGCGAPDYSITEYDIDSMNNKLPKWLADRGIIVAAPGDQAAFTTNDRYTRCLFGYKDHTFKTEITKAEIEEMKASAFKTKLLAEFSHLETEELANIAKTRPEWNRENVTKWLADDDYYHQVDPECLIKYFKNRDKRTIGALNAMKLIQAISDHYAYGYEPSGLIRRWAVDDDDQKLVTREMQFGSCIPASDVKFIDYFQECNNAPIVSLEERMNDGKTREQRFYEDIERYNKEGTFDSYCLQFEDEKKDLENGLDCQLKKDIETSISKEDLSGKTPEEIYALAFKNGITNGLHRAAAF